MDVLYFETYNVGLISSLFYGLKQNESKHGSTTTTFVFLTPAVVARKLHYYNYYKTNSSTLCMHLRIHLFVFT